MRKHLVPTTTSLGIPSIASTADRESWDHYGCLRDAGGVVWDEEMDGWLVASYALVRQAGADADDALWHKPRVPTDGYVPFGWSRAARARRPAAEQPRDRDHFRRPWTPLYAHFAPAAGQLDQGGTR